MNPYLAIIKDSFREAFSSRVLRRGLICETSRFLTFIRAKALIHKEKV